MNSGDRFEKWTKAEGTEGILVEALERLARLGNEPHVGNSDGNMIARYALDEYRRLRLNAAEKATAPAGCGLREFIVRLVDRAKHLGHARVDIPVRIFEKSLENYPCTRHAADEPLAVLADRKGYAVYSNNRIRKPISDMPWHISITFIKDTNKRTSFYTRSYAEAEAKARAYLNGLNDKKENI